MRAALFGLAVVARLGGAQEVPRSPTGGTVSGTVRDSIARLPLAGAVVQLAVSSAGTMTARTAVSDSVGRFIIRDVPDGRHTIGFFHPMLDSLGLDAPQRAVNVGPNESVRMDLAIPSAERIRASACALAASPTHTLIIGFVRRANDGAH